MDNDYSVDLAEIAATLRTAEVVTMRFITVGQRLLLDFRATDIDGPLIRVVRPVRSVQERYAELKALRPRLAPPEKIVAIWWPRYVASLRSTEVWDEVMRRVSDTGLVTAVRAADDALATLLSMEAQQRRAAISGDGFKTLWSAGGATRRP